MEKVYRKFLGDSVSSTIDFKNYFVEYKSEIAKVYGPDGEIGVTHAFSNLIKFTEEQENILAHTCSIDKLDPPNPLEKMDVEPLYTRPELYEKIPAPENCCLRTVQSVLSRSEADQEEIVRASKYRGRKITLSDEHKLLNRDMHASDDVVMTILIYAPYSSVKHYNGKFNKIVDKRPRVSQELLVLGSQTLDVLRDAILCVEDFNDTQGDVSENPFDNDGIHQSRAKYPSAMFYFGNNFYIDTREAACKDYSESIREYGEKNGIVFGETRSMEQSFFIDLQLKLGHPYVYRHQGICEHIIVFKNARLIHFYDPRVSHLYPLHEAICPSRARFCNICGSLIAKWCVQDCERLPNDPSYLCSDCFKGYLYKDGEKICQFKAYKFCDAKAIL